MWLPKRPPPVTEKSHSALRFGILGAARVAPDAIIHPAKTHPDVVISAVACRDKHRGLEYAQKHHIERTFSGAQAYHELVADPEVDVIYVALPNGLHFEWAMRALQAGKHVVVEKPMTNTAEEARQIFVLAERKALVVLEAIHCTFHPALQRARDIVASGELGKVKSVTANFALPSVMSPFFFRKDDPRFYFELGGGCMMDMGVYPLAALRFITSSDTAPLTITSATAVGQALDPARVDRSMHAKFTLPNSHATGELTVDFGIPGLGPFGLIPRMIKNEIVVSTEGGEVLVYNFVSPGVFHYIRAKSKKGRTRYEQAYTFKDGRGRKDWSSYRYQLEAFVDKVRGRTPSTWPEAATIVTELQSIESIYVKAGLPVRNVSSYKPDDELETR